MKTAIIGLGNIGSRVASNLVAGGDNVIAAECGETYGLRDSPAIFSRPRLDALMVGRPESPALFAFRLPAPPRRCPYPGRRTVLRQKRIRRLH